jgi:hypothetical protein
LQASAKHPGLDLRQESSIVVRSWLPNDWHLAIGIYNFANGVLRGVAAGLLWQLLVHLHRKRHDLDPAWNWQDPALILLVQSLWQIPCIWEVHGDGSERACIVAQMARQNQAAEVQPVSTLQFVQIILQQTLPGGGAMASTTSMTRRQLQETLAALSTAYNQHPDVVAYDELARQDCSQVPAAKKRKSGSTTSSMRESEKEMETLNVAGGIRMGSRKLQAIKNFLVGGTDKTLRLLIMHQHRTEWRFSCISDDTLCFPWLFIKSTLPDELAPGRTNATDFAPSISPSAPNGWKSECLTSFGGLTEEEFDAIWVKALAWFNARTAHLDFSSTKAKYRPSQADWVNFRLVVQFWFRVMRNCCAKDMDPENYKDHLDTVLQGDALDGELIGMLSRGISFFHIGMLTSCAAQLTEDSYACSGAVQKSILEAAQARLNLLSLLLKGDWANIVKLQTGKNALADLLAWLEASHRREQAALGQARPKSQDMKPCNNTSNNEELVLDYVDNHFQFLGHTQGIDAVQPALMEKWEKIQCRNPYIVVWIDFNSPFSRDTVKLTKLIQFIGFCLGRSRRRSVCVMWMADIPKGADVPLHQEVSTLVNHLAGQGMDATTDIVCSTRTVCTPNPALWNSTPIHQNVPGQTQAGRAESSALGSLQAS